MDPNTLWDFNSLCAALRQHRLSNPRFKLETDMGKIQEEVDSTNAQRMTTIPGAESYYVRGGSAVFHKPLREIQSRVSKANAAAANFRSGVGVMIDLFGSGLSPVSKELAEKRAKTCVECPLNNRASTLEKVFTLPAVLAISKKLEIVNGLELSTSQDSKLNICDACFCVLKLAVHIPIEQKLKDLTPEAKAKLVPNCWQLTESKS